MMRWRLLSICLVGIVSVQASAEESAPRQARPPVGVAKGGDAQRTLVQIADCAVVHHRELVDDFLSQPPGSKGERRPAERIKGRCLKNGLILFEPQLLRGALYERLYARDFSGWQQAQLSRVAAVAALPPVAADQPPEDVARYNLQRLADCAVSVNPMGAHQLVLSRLGSREETASFQSLVPNFSDCLVAGEELKFSREILRGYVAEALYRRARTSSELAQGAAQ